MSKNGFVEPKHIEVKIHDENDTVVGTIRVKPNGILWKPKGAKGATPWFSLTLEEFADYAKKNGAKIAH
jgi:hypothetical protein